MTRLTRIRLAIPMFAAAMLASCSYPIDLFVVHSCGEVIKVEVRGGDNDTKPTRSLVQSNEPTNVHHTCCGQQDSFTVIVGTWSQDIDPNGFGETDPYQLPLEACP